MVAGWTRSEWYETLTKTEPHSNNIDGYLNLKKEDQPKKRKVAPLLKGLQSATAQTQHNEGEDFKALSQPLLDRREKPSTTTNRK
jgi:hypothetical protein